MRSVIVVLAFIFLPFSAMAASIGDFNGKWQVDLVTTVEKNPGMKPDEEMLKLTLSIDAKAKTIHMDYGRKATAKPFTVEEESPSGVTIKRADNRLLKLSGYGKDQLAIGEIRDQKLWHVMYFIRKKK